MKACNCTILSIMGAVILVSAGLISCSKKAADTEAEAVFAVNTFKTVKSSLDDYLEFGGDVAAVSSVDVVPDVGGKVSRIYVSVGDKVVKDQVIAEVDPSRPGMNYSASPVKAPISGTVISFSPSIGSMVSQSMGMAKVSRTDQTEIRTSVAERYISRIKLNQQAIITFDAYPGEKFTARVFEVSPVLDTTTRTMGIKLRIEPPDSRIKVGMYARIHLVTDHVLNALVIPYTAILVRNEQQYVFIASPETTDGKNATAHPDRTVRLQKVTTGLHVDDRIEITGGITVGDEIVVRGQTLLNDGSKINVISVSNDSLK
jgi:membrane fusion protein, multidrug efflux system